MTIWTYTRIDVEAIRDDPGSAECVAPWIAWTTPDAAKSAAIREVNDEIEGDLRDGIDDRQPLDPAKVEWVEVKVGDQTCWIWDPEDFDRITVYPMEVKE